MWVIPLLLSLSEFTHSWMNKIEDVQICCLKLFENIQSLQNYLKHLKTKIFIHIILIGIVVFLLGML